MNTQYRIGMSALAVAMAVSFQGCEKKADEAGAEAAAKVNGVAISVALLDHEVKKLGDLTPEQHQKAANQVLKNLVDQDLLMQKAVSEKLDQEAGVKLALEASRRQILSQAYVEKLTASVAQPTEQEVSDYFNKHPELFSDRRIYRLQEINISVTPDNEEAVKSQLSGTRSLDDFIQWLRDQKIPVRISQTTKAAEQLPTELLPRLAQMRDGQAMTVKAPNALNILVVAGSQSQPVTLEQAKASIERFVTNSKKRETAATALKDMRAQAKVEYLGAYADLGKEAPTPEPAVEAQATEAKPDAAPASEPAAK
ncbi:MAG: peptidyl-prolyl cis-trans isomerase, EpsD family [Thiobacillus sp.]|nr:peptidyl-prolyl cis-trans isomerase, EpsD family [Thiobacillus sp.]